MIQEWGLGCAPANQSCGHTPRVPTGNSAEIVVLHAVEKRSDDQWYKSISRSSPAKATHVLKKVCCMCTHVAVPQPRFGVPDARGETQKNCMCRGQPPVAGCWRWLREDVACRSRGSAAAAHAAYPVLP